jgi:hypothetical protein
VSMDCKNYGQLKSFHNEVHVGFQKPYLMAKEKVASKALLVVLRRIENRAKIIVCASQPFPGLGNC